MRFSQVRENLISSGKIFIAVRWDMAPGEVCEDMSTPTGRYAVGRRRGRNGIGSDGN
jgi:hypothetical protein